MNITYDIHIISWIIVKSNIFRFRKSPPSTRHPSNLTTAYFQDFHSMFVAYFI